MLCSQNGKKLKINRKQITSLGYFNKKWRGNEEEGLERLIKLFSSRRFPSVLTVLIQWNYKLQTYWNWVIKCLQERERKKVH